MPYIVHIPDGKPWIVAEVWGFADTEDVVGARRDMARANVDNAYRKFIFDASAVTELDLTLEARDGIVDIDRTRSLVIPEGECAFVVPRETVLMGMEMLARSSKMPIDFRSFGTRAGAEAWLRGDAPDSGIRAPRRRRLRQPE